MRALHFRRFIFACIVASLTPAQAQDATLVAPHRIAVRAAHLIDPVAGKRLDNVVVLIENDRIVASGSGLTIPRDAELIDLGRATLLPTPRNDADQRDSHGHNERRGADWLE